MISNILEAIRRRDFPTFSIVLESYQGSLDDVCQNQTLLNEAAKWDNADFVKCLLDKGADPNRSHPLVEAGRQPLHEAVRYQSAENVRLLLASGANVNGKDSEGRSPIWGFGNLEITRILLDAGAEINGTAEDGGTLLHHCDSDCVSLLVNAGLEINAKNLRGETPLLVASTKCGDIEPYLDLGADVNARCLEGNTALHGLAFAYASPYLRINGMKRLVQLGLDIDVVNHAGESPLFFALDIVEFMGLGFEADDTVLQFLLDAGANPHLKNQSGKNAFDLAERLYHDHDDEWRAMPDYPEQAYWDDNRQKVMVALKKRRPKPGPDFFTIEPIKECKTQSGNKIPVTLRVSRQWASRFGVMAPSMGDPLLYVTVSYGSTGAWFFRRKDDQQVLVFHHADQGDRWEWRGEMMPGPYRVILGLRQFWHMSKRHFVVKDDISTIELG